MAKNLEEIANLGLEELNKLMPVESYDEGESNRWAELTRFCPIPDMLHLSDEEKAQVKLAEQLLKE